MKGKKQVLFVCVVALATVLAIGAASMAAAQGSDPAGANDQDPKYHSSITVDERQVAGSSEEAEAKALAPLAKISESEAKAAAEAAAGGTASETELGNENGALVFEVQVGDKEVKVDAGNGKVLRIEKDDGEEGAKTGTED